MTDREAALQVLKGRAATLKQACLDKKLAPDALTAAAMLYNAMKLLGLPADTIMDGPLSISIEQIVRSITEKGQSTQPKADDPDAPVTLTNAQLVQLLNSKVGEA